MPEGANFKPKKMYPATTTIGLLLLFLFLLLLLFLCGAENRYNSIDSWRVEGREGKEGRAGREGDSLGFSAVVCIKNGLQSRLILVFQ